MAKSVKGPIGPAKSGGAKAPAKKSSKKPAAKAAAKTQAAAQAKAKPAPKAGNGKGAATAQANPQLDPAVVKKVEAVRAQVREGFGKIVMAMMILPRYRSQSIADLQHLVLEPLIRDRIAIAHPGKKSKSEVSDMAGVAVWASVSEEVDKSIREQIKAGVFPVRLKAEDWTSGNINWLLDVIAPDSKTTSSVIANFGSVVKGGDLRIHPIISRLVDDETLKKMGAQKMGGKS